VWRGLRLEEGFGKEGNINITTFQKNLVLISKNTAHIPIPNPDVTLLDWRRFSSGTVTFTLIFRLLTFGTTI
jgi:hypothetical protein